MCCQELVEKIKRVMVERVKAEGWEEEVRVLWCCGVSSEDEDYYLEC